MRKHLECIIHGRVHGVFYRDATSRKARALGLNGFVENQPDNMVRVVAEGEEAVLREFLTYLWKGSPFSKVERVEEKWSDATGEFTDFQIMYRSFLDRF